MIIFDEMGCDMIPVDEFESHYRYYGGTVHQHIAEHAEKKLWNRKGKGKLNDMSYTSC